ncbi:MAG: hypothetical protein Q7S00_01160 [bacterium]|nr:hypothetical protein [bacterium]
MKSSHFRFTSLGIFALCFGYFLFYIPFSMMTKMITRGLFDGMNGVGIEGFELQPMVIVISTVCMLTFITAAGWWKYMTHSSVLGISLPRPQWFTFISGICMGGQIITTVLAYTFQGVSIVFVMLLMRGGVLIMAPVVDLIARRKRKIYWPSWVAACLSLMAVLIAFAEQAGTAMTVVATVDVGLYLLGYFFRLLFMSNRAKTEDPIEKRRFFAEEQVTANIVLLLTLLVVGLIGSRMDPQSIPGMIWSGFSTVPFLGYFPQIIIIGVSSYAVGLLGSLIYLDQRENTFTVPANRASSVLAGLVATSLLAFFFGRRFPGPFQLIAVGLVIGAIFFLYYRSISPLPLGRGFEGRGRKQSEPI